ncbi:MAG TPA: sulfurylase large subunit, partial [Acidimicrobiaceae bacterium]|nr:sulfurylase large subunit [Acidimicrobiaceae bacterium]
MSGTPIFDRLAALLRDEVPVALATVLDGERAGAKLMVHRPAADEVEVDGTLGDEDL